MNSKKTLLIVIASVVAGLVLLSVGVGTSMYVASRMKMQSHATEEIKTSDAPKKKASETKEEIPKETKAEKLVALKVYSLDLTEADFRERFNNAAARELSDLGLYLKREYVYNGDYASVYQNAFDNANSLVVSYEPSSERLRGVLLTGTGQTQDETVMFFGVIAGIIASLNPELTPPDRKALLQELGMFNSNGIDYQRINKTAYRNNVKYKIQGTDGNGVAFFATAKDIETHGGSSVKRDSPYNIMADVTNYIVWERENQQASAKQEASAPPASTKTMADENMNYYARYAAETTLISFHSSITAKNYRGAYDCMTPNLQRQMPYEGWAKGFRTTVTSSVSDFNLVSQTPDRIVLTYTLKAEDDPGGVQYFKGTAVLVRDRYDWKIDDIRNKRM